MEFIEKHKVKTFDDLVFKPHRHLTLIERATHAVMEFPNTHSIYVVFGTDGTKFYEAWASHESEPRHFLSKNEVTELMLVTQSRKKEDFNYMN
jgi:hypothetical protein